ACGRLYGRWHSRWIVMKKAHSSCQIAFRFHRYDSTDTCTSALFPLRYGARRVPQNMWRPWGSRHDLWWLISVDALGSRRMAQPSHQPIVHLVGSVPLPDPETVFHTLSGALGTYLKRMPDGETGRRARWIRFVHQHLEAHPDMEVD